MYKETYYVYLGTNGTITSTVHLEDIYYTLRYKLTAESGKRLTKDGKNYVTSILVSPEEVVDWQEVNKP